MSLRRTPGVICQCQAGTPVDTGTLSLTSGGLPGPSRESTAARTAASNIYESVLNQTPVSMSWDSIRMAAQVARSNAQAAISSSISLTLSEAVYGFAVRQVAEQYLDVREHGSNRGPEVEAFQDTVNAPGHGAWCAAFVSHCHFEAANFLCASTTCPRTFRAVMMIFEGRDAANLTFSKQSVLDGSRLPIAGDVFVMVTQGSVRALNPGQPTARRRGHTGMVVSYNAATSTLTTIEGNTDPGGSRDGDGVYMRSDRMGSNQLWGFMRPRVVWN